MDTYIISSEITKMEYTKKAGSMQEVIEWVENHLDLSGNWKIELSKIKL